MSKFQPLDWMRNVCASHIGQRSPVGRMKKKITVAAIARRTKNPTKATAKSTASDIIPDLETCELPDELPELP